MYQVVQIFQKLKLFNKFNKIKVKIKNIQFNIMIVDIDKKNNNLILMNILQLKWILYIQILKKNYKKIYKKSIIQMIIKVFIFH